MQWFAGQSYLRLFSGVLFWGIAGFLYFRRSQGLGKVLFVLLSVVVAALFYLSPWIQIISSWLLMLSLAISYLNSRRPREEYQPAVALVEGGGIKRGLLPPEAAILLGAPFNLIIVIVLFGMLKRGILKEVNGMPWQLEVEERFRTHEASLDHKRKMGIRQEAALNANIILQKYEELFLELFEEAEGKEAKVMDFGIIVKPLVKHVVERVAGYDLEKTREYYDLIINRAHIEAREGGELLSDREAIFDRNLEWIMLNENLGTVFENNDFSCMPIWKRDRESLAKKLSGEKTFSAWILRIIEEMKGSVPPEALDINIDGESENVLAGLLSEISRATFYG
ncbi:MAG: hypothetical protein FVQ83_04985 [Chloroflexi bacterium]|nr:hypothetical protein [Chloroflexota bacterium]